MAEAASAPTATRFDNEFCNGEVLTASEAAYAATSPQQQSAVARRRTARIDRSAI